MDVLRDGDPLELPSLKRKAKLVGALPGLIASKFDNDLEIDQLIGFLDKSTKQRKSSQAAPAQDAALPNILENILHKVWELPDSKDKIHWIQKGLLQALINTMCLNVKRAQSNATAIEICKCLLYNDREASSLFCRQILAHLAGDNECVGVSDCLAQLIIVHPVRSVFIEELGVAKLLDIYANISMEYNPDQGLAKDTPPKESIFPKDDDFKDIPFNPINRYFSAPSMFSQGDDSLKHLDSNIIPNTINTSPLASPGHVHTSPPGSFSNKASASPTSPPKSASPFGYTGSLQHMADQSFAGSVDGTRAPFHSHSPFQDPARPRAASLAMMKPAGSPSSSLPPKPSVSPSTKAPSSRPPIPKLNLPLRVESVGKMNSRSSRRLEEVGSSSNRGAPTSNEIDFVQTASKELNDLATKLGESYMAADLTALLSYKQVIDAQASRTVGNGLNSKGTLAKRIPHIGYSTLEAGFKSPPRTEVVVLRNSGAYKVKTSILRVLALVTAQPSILKYIHSPVNVLYTELVEIYHNLMPADDEYKLLIYNILANWADYVEYLHRHRWREITKGMSVDRKESFRKKLDKLLWRIHNNLASHLENEDYSDTNILLSILGEYMQNCPTRVMSSQVVDVCMETLLKIKHLAFHRGKFSAERLHELRTMHNLLVVFDSIAAQNMQHHHPLNDLLLAVFVEREDTFTHTKQFAAQVLFGHNVESELLRDPASGRVTLTDFRVRVIKHFEVCVDMIQRAQDAEMQHEFHSRPNEVGTPGSSKSSSSSEYTGVGNHKLTVVELLRKFEFLLLPGSGGGYIMQFLSQGSHYEGYLVKRQMLQLLCKIFEFKGNPFVRRKQYIDAYVSYFYTRFIKLYHSYVLDAPTLEMCRLHLRLLLAFSQCKAEKIAMKFFQLRAMDFLVREVSLEYEVKLNRELKDNIPFFIPPRGHKAKAKPEQTVAAATPPPVASAKPSMARLNIARVMPPNDSESKEKEKEKEKEEEKVEKDKITAVKLPALRLSATANEEPKTPPVAEPAKKPVPSLKLGGFAPKEKEEGAKPAPPAFSLKLALPPKDPPPSAPSAPAEEEKRPPVLGLSKLAIPSLKIPAGAKVKHDKADAEGTSGILSSLEKKIDPHDPKFQLVLDNPVASSATNAPSNAGAAQLDRPPTPADLLAENQRYANERSNRKLYSDKDLHIALLQLIFSLMITQNDTLDPLYSDQFPLVAKKLNIPYILHLHINHPMNEVVVSELVGATLTMGQPYFRLLKLLFTKLFHPELYSGLRRVAKGAYGTVFKGSLSYQGPDEGTEIAAKLMPLPKSSHDRCVLHDIFTEILILDKYKLDQRCCHLYDYGVDGESYWLIMKSYKCSLKDWRVRQTAPFMENLPLYLNIFMNILTTFQFLMENKINHFDIKCDNFLLHPRDDTTLEDSFWNQPDDSPNFIVCLADFGEAKVYSSELEGYTTRNRGTEFIKSPEMLTVAYASQKTRETFDRRKKVGSNSASDIWSLGCLLYELLTGEFLFYDDDSIHFFIRVTSPGQELITEERKTSIANLPPLIEFLDFMFIRDPAYRPGLRDVIAKFSYVRTQVLGLMSNQSTPPEKTITRPPTPVILTHVKSDSEKIQAKEPPTGRYNPGRYSPHIPPPLPLALLQPKPSPRESPFDKPPDPPLELEFPQHSFFMSAPSQITPYLYISSYNPSLDKTNLKSNLNITHIVNCTGSPSAFPDHFDYLHLKLHDDGGQDILSPLPRVLDFIRDALLHKGKVLIFSDKGVSRAPALAIAYLMDCSGLTYFESLLYVRDRRYIIAPNTGFVQQLGKWGTLRRMQRGQTITYAPNTTKSGYSKNVLRYQCMCGACTFTVLEPFDSSKYQNPRPCSCMFDEPADCPNISCSNFLEEMKKLHNFKAESIVWGYTVLGNVMSDFERTTAEYHPMNEVPALLKASIIPKDWKLYRCKTCHFLTHAVSTKARLTPPSTTLTADTPKSEKDPNKDKAIAIVTNIIHHTQSSIP